ncbi:basic blue protein-like [Panicum miliaceum]|uniref:Basic blue protein-like n=1 Tax=Panicum miliaceum TaxID=4540 RepID=A0A3L6QRA9_PANMI|nr:basic blue protein-like [Panicum miliaceum]
MASRLVLLLAAAAVAVACLPAPASAVAWMVGDGGGWRAKFNQTGWADGKTFRVGDTLMFMYARDAHTVVEVGREDFAACNLQANLLGAWNSGNDVVQLDRPGKRWFFCSVPGHCDNGMKLAVNVVGDDGVPAPAPAPESGWWF